MQVCFSFRSGFPFTLQSRFASGSPSDSRLHPVHHPLPVFDDSPAGIPVQVCFSFRSGFPFTLQSRFASGSPSDSRLHPVHHPLPVSLFVSVSRALVTPGLHQSHPQLSVYIRSPSITDFSFRLRFTFACQSRYSFCLLFSFSPFCPELSFPFLPSLSAPFCRPASPLPCSG